MTVSIKKILVLMAWVFLSSGAQACSNLDQLQWLVGEWKGEWKNANNVGVILESWQQTSALTFEGVGIRLASNGEEVDREWLRILGMKDQIFYLAKVDHNQLPVPFILTHCRDDYLRFQNPEHDFPKQIIYQKTDANTLVVTISDGGSQSSAITFSKQ